MTPLVVSRGRRTPCEAARARASWALDGELDDVGHVLLRAHLGLCGDCARVVAGMQATQAVIADTPLVPFTCVVPRLGHQRWVGAVTRLRLTGIAAVVVVAGSALSFSLADDIRIVPATRPLASAKRPAVIPFRLPIGQRLARDDFMSSALSR